MNLGLEKDGKERVGWELETSGADGVFPPIFLTRAESPVRGRRRRDSRTLTRISSL